MLRFVWLPCLLLSMMSHFCEAGEAEDRQILEARFEAASGDQRTKLLFELGPMYQKVDPALGASLSKELLVNYPGPSIYRAKLLRWLAAFHTMTGDWQEVESYALQALELSRNLGAVNTELKVLNILGALDYRLFNYQQALEYFKATVELAERFQLKEQMVNPLGNLSSVYAELKNYDQAEQYLKRSIALEQELGIDSIGNEISLVGIYISQQRMQLAIALLASVRDKLDAGASPANYNLGELRYYMADNYIFLKQPQDALELLIPAEEEFARLENIHFLTLTHIVKADSLNLLGDIEDGLAEVAKALVLAHQSGVKEMESYALETQSELYESQGDFRQALASYKAHKALSDELLHLEKDNSSDFLSNKIELANKSRELLELQQTQSLQNVERQQELLLWRLGMVVLCLMIMSTIAGIVYITSRKRAVEEAFRQLQQTQQQLVESEKIATSGRLVSGIAQQLHSPLGVVVRICKMISSRCIQLDDSLELSFSTIDKNLLKLNELADNLNKVVNDTSPSRQQGICLKELLQTAIVPIQEQLDKHQVSLSIDCDPDLEVCSSRDELTQVFSELINNSLEHAFEEGQPATISIAANVVNGDIVIRYQDNGRGISPAVARSMFEAFNTSKYSQGNAGLGLHLLYNQVRQRLNGDIHYRADVSPGACFELYFPHH